MLLLCIFCILHLVFGLYNFFGLKHNKRKSSSFSLSQTFNITTAGDTWFSLDWKADWGWTSSLCDLTVAAYPERCSAPRFRSTQILHPPPWPPLASCCGPHPIQDDGAGLRDSSLFWHLSGGTNSWPMPGQWNHSPSSAKNSRLVYSDFTSLHISRDCFPIKYCLEVKRRYCSK